MRLLLLLMVGYLASVRVQAGIPLVHSKLVGADADQACSHFSEIVAVSVLPVLPYPTAHMFHCLTWERATNKQPSHGDVVSERHFVLHVRCLAECGIQPQDSVKIYLNEELHPHPAVELECEERSATMRHIVVTEPPPGLWTATIKTFRSGKQLDEHQFMVSFIIHTPPAPLDASTMLRSSPWEEDANDVGLVWGRDWGMKLPPGSAQCATGANAIVERCVLTNTMAANGTFFLWPGSPEDSRRAFVSAQQQRLGALELLDASVQGFSLYACPGGDKSACWGYPAQVDVRYWQDHREHDAAGVCDTVVTGDAVIFSLPFLGSALSVLMDGITALVSTLRDDMQQTQASSSTRERVRPAEKTLLISNAAPPVEASLGPYLPLFQALSSRPVVSMTELSLQGSVCFERLFVGTRHLLHLSSAEHLQQPVGHQAAVVKEWWETMQGSLREAVTRTRVLVTRALDLDASIVRRFRGGARVLLAARYGRLNRDWLDVDALVQGLRRVPGVVGVSTGRLTLTRSQDEAAEHWEEGWGEQEPAGMEARADGGKLRRPREALMTLVARLQNCSILIGVTGDALASALWMPPGTLVLQVFPYGVKGHYGREYAVLAQAGPGNYLEMELKGSAARFYPWPPHPTAMDNAALYWEQDPGGAEQLYMKAGGISVDGEDLFEIVSRAVRIVNARDELEDDLTGAPQTTSDAGYMAAAGSATFAGFDISNGYGMAWHRAEGSVALLPSRGRYA